MILAELFPYAHVVFKVFTILYLLASLTVIGVVISENRNPVKSMAWVLVLLLLPVAGLIIYLVFGRSLKGMKLISRSDLRELRAMNHFPEHGELPEGLTDESHQIIAMVDKLIEPHLFAGNSIDVFTSGQDKFDALKRDIAAAQDYIHIQYFIIEYDAIGKEIIGLLADKARQGVAVRVLYDYVGSHPMSARALKLMRSAGIEVHAFMQVTLANMPFRINWRNHRKVAVIDGKVGYMGGMNIADRYVTGSKKQRPWRDTHYRITGEAVSALQASFAIDWNFTTRKLLNVEAQPIARPDGGGCLMQMANSGPASRWNNISMIFLNAISLAKRSVYLQTPYFLPSDALLQVLQSGALSGVDVRVMLPARTDSRLLQLATGSYIKECLLAGIKIYFYEPTMLHAKVLIIDDEFVTSGSTNFDFRSFEHNFEINALVYDKGFNRQMKDIFEQDMQQSARMSMGRWKRRPLVQKALESVVRLISPIL